MSLPSFPCGGCEVQVTPISGLDVASIKYITEGPKAGLIEVMAKRNWLGGEGVEFAVFCGDDFFTQVIRRSNTPPSAPMNLTVSRIEPPASQEVSCSEAVLEWTAPHDGGRPISYYQIQYRLTGTTQWITIGRPTSTATSETLTGLLPVSYEFRVLAANDQSTLAASQGGILSDASNVARLGTPLGPAEISAIERGPCSRALVLWRPPELPECSAIDSYVVQYRAIDGGPWLEPPPPPGGKISANSTAAIVPNLTPDIPYLFRVIRIDAAGQRLPSAVVRSGNLPSAPFEVTARLGTVTGRVDIEWDADEEACYENNTYNVQQRMSDSGEWTNISLPSSAEKKRTVTTGLSVGNYYYFRVRAVNVIGRGEYSAPSNPVLIEQIQ
jgi:hypothetical protein